MSDEEEQITVTRQEDERDPEADAEFDRELAKLMSESVESRKFERKPVFDVPLPMRRAREPTTTSEESGEAAAAQNGPTNTMKFSLLSKRGNKQQTRSIDLPSDSTFAVSMRSKQQEEKEERQRIKNVVLNYDINRDDNDADGDSPFLYHLHPNENRKHTETSKVLDKSHNPYAQPRLDKAGNNRSNQRSRKLQLSDVNWYDSPSSQSHALRNSLPVISPYSPRTKGSQRSDQQATPSLFPTSTSKFPRLFHSTSSRRPQRVSSNGIDAEDHTRASQTAG
jgi:regulator of nonsense transcripts 2